MANKYQKQVPDVISISNNIDLKLFRKAVWLSNNIIQVEKIPYVEKMLSNVKGETLYYYPLITPIDSKINTSFSKAVIIVYDAIKMDRNITAAEMEELNIIYKKVKKEYGT